LSGVRRKDRAALREVTQGVMCVFKRRDGHANHKTYIHSIRAVFKHIGLLFDPAPHARFLRVAYFHRKRCKRNPFDARCVLQDACNRIRIGTHEPTRTELDAAVIANDGSQHAIEIVMAQHFENRPAGGARWLAVVGHARLAAGEQGPADVRCRRMGFAQAA